MPLKGLMSNLSFVKENRSRLIMWAVTLAAGLCRHVVVHSLASQSSDYGTPFFASCHQWTMVVFHKHELAATTTDGIIHFVFLSAQNYASFEAFCSLWFWLIRMKSMTEQINLGDELLFLQYYHAFEEILKRTDLFLWFIVLLKLGTFCDRMYIVWTVEIIEISNVWFCVCEQRCLATHKASLTDSFSGFTSTIQHYSTK